MSQEKYNLIHHKDFHNLQLQNYSVKERAVFLTLCLKVMEQEDDVVVFDIAELAKISNYAPRKKGDNIIISEYAGTKVKYEGEEYIILREEDILAVVK